MVHSRVMFDWSDEKDACFRKKRGIGFQDVVFYIEKGEVLAVIDHPNKEVYPNQKIIYDHTVDYVYMVPFVETGEKKLLKTIIPSQKATGKYLEEEK